MSSVAANDRGLAYGDGLFETVVVHNGVCPYWPLHRQRLQTGADKLDIIVPNGIDAEVVQAAAEQSVNMPLSILKIILTRGVGGRGYAPAAPDSASKPTLLLQHHAWPDYPQTYRTNGITLKWLNFRLACQPHLVGIKHLNRLEQVLAARELQQYQDAQEGLLLNTSGDVISGCKSNLFVVQPTEHGSVQLLTPAIETAGIAGTMRVAVLEYAEKLGFSVQIQPLSRYDVEQGAGWFMTNAIIGIWPVQKLGELTATPEALAVIQQLQQSLPEAIWPLTYPA